MIPNDYELITQFKKEFNEGREYYKSLHHVDKVVDWESVTFDIQELSHIITYNNTLSNYAFYNEQIDYDAELHLIHSNYDSFEKRMAFYKGYQHQMNIELTQNYIANMEAFLEDDEEVE